MGSVGIGFDEWSLGFWRTEGRVYGARGRRDGPGGTGGLGRVDCLGRYGRRGRGGRRSTSRYLPGVRGVWSFSVLAELVKLPFSCGLTIVPSKILMNTCQTCYKHPRYNRASLPYTSPQN